MSVKREKFEALSNKLKTNSCQKVEKGAKFDSMEFKKIESN